MLADSAAAALVARAEWKLWHYTPSLPAAIIFLVIFLAMSILHTWTMVRTRLWFCTAFVVGGYSASEPSSPLTRTLHPAPCTLHSPLNVSADPPKTVEVIGYIGRIASRSDPTSLGPYTVQAIFLLIPPSVFSASLYMGLGRLMSSLGPKAESMSLVRPGWLTKIFVTGDVLSFLIQGAGAGLMSHGIDWVTRGSHIVIVGLVVQIVFFGMFIVTAILFHVRWSKAEKLQQNRHDDHHHQQERQNHHWSDGAAGSWRTMLNMLYVTSGLILLRSVFRVIEYSMGFVGYPMVHEWTLYVFDSVPMAAVMVVYWWWYPTVVRGPGLSVPSSVVLGEVEQA